jgi:putative hydrolase of the HAD superfamily
VVYVDSYRLLDELHKRGYAIGLVSNREDELDTYVASVNLRQYFKFTLSGGQAGSYKPDPGIFRKALEIAGTTADEALYVGDNFYADVLGAQGVGMQSVLVDPRNAFANFHYRRIRHLRDLLKFLST